MQHLFHHGLRHDVARSQVAALVMPQHEGLPVLVQQARAFAAHGLGDEGAAVAALLIQGRGVELHEFQIGQRHAGTCGHGDARAHAAGGIGGVQEDLAHAAGGQHGPVGEDGLRFAALLVEDIGPEAAVGDAVAVLSDAVVVAAGQKIDGGPPEKAGDARMGRHLRREAVHDGLAGIIGPVQDARRAVAAFPREVETAVGVAVELDPRAFEQHLVHADGALAAELPHGRAGVVAVARHHDVMFQSARFGFRIIGGGAIDDAALRQFGIPLAEVVPGADQQNLMAGVGQRERGRATGDAGPDDQDRHMTTGVTHDLASMPAGGWRLAPEQRNAAAPAAGKGRDAPAKMTPCSRRLRRRRRYPAFGSGSGGPAGRGPGPRRGAWPYRPRWPAAW